MTKTWSCWFDRMDNFNKRDMKSANNQCSSAQLHTNIITFSISYICMFRCNRGGLAWIAVYVRKFSCNANSRRRFTCSEELRTLIFLIIMCRPFQMPIKIPKNGTKHGSSVSIRIWGAWHVSKSLHNLVSTLACEDHALYAYLVTNVSAFNIPITQVIQEEVVAAW